MPDELPDQGAPKVSCKDTQELLDGYLDGELDIVRGMEIEGHLRRCPACSQVYENHQALRSAIRARAPYFKAPAGLHQRVRSTVRQASKAEPAGADRLEQIGRAHV